MVVYGELFWAVVANPPDQSVYAPLPSSPTRPTPIASPSCSLLLVTHHSHSHHGTSSSPPAHPSTKSRSCLPMETDELFPKMPAEFRPRGGLFPSTRRYLIGIALLLCVVLVRALPALFKLQPTDISSGPRPTLSRTTSRQVMMGGTSHSCAFSSLGVSFADTQDHVPQHIVVRVLPHPCGLEAVAQGHSPERSVRLPAK